MFKRRMASKRDEVRLKQHLQKTNPPLSTTNNPLATERDQRAKERLTKKAKVEDTENANPNTVAAAPVAIQKAGFASPKKPVRRAKKKQEAAKKAAKKAEEADISSQDFQEAPPPPPPAVEPKGTVAPAQSTGWFSFFVPSFFCVPMGNPTDASAPGSP